MRNNNTIHIALVGNPNSGKSSLFNSLTGLNQKVGNFPGVTVDKKVGRCTLTTTLNAQIIDLPGTYSLYPRREDEWVSYKVLLQQDKDILPDLIVLVVDAANLKRNLLFCSQVIDLKRPVVIALTMVDLARKKDTDIDVAGLSRALKVPVVVVNPRKNKGIEVLKKTITQTLTQQTTTPSTHYFIDIQSLASAAIQSTQKILPQLSDYAAVHYLTNHESFALSNNTQQAIEEIEKENAFNPTKFQAAEIIQRYARIKSIMQKTVVEKDPLARNLITEKIDSLLLHRRWGYIILLGVLFFLFQSIFWFARYPMQAIEWAFTQTGSWLGNILPATWWSDLTVNGLLAGFSGILIFVPQIMILFALITLLEDTGYMARISFLTDRIMRSIGLNGKSVMPLISGMACAVPAIMSARSIENKKERLITILVTPLISCSARLPVYTILIALVVPDKYLLGFLSIQGLVMMGLYLLGFVMAMLVAYILKWLIKIKERSFFILELPLYRPPRWKNMVVAMVQKAKIFVRDAGKIIMIISLLLWLLSSFGPSNKQAALQKEYTILKQQYPKKIQALEKEYKAKKLENSYAGIIGHTIEPIIQPLGFDWKIGIALVTSFAAREVFVGTMATLYSVEEDDANSSLRQKLHTAVRPNGKLVYDTATSFSLMIFYVLAMQCMSTLAVVKRETKTWKWPIIQLIYMTGLAYIMSFLVYQLLK